MPRVLLQPAASASAQKHFEDTIRQPVSLDGIRHLLSPEQRSAAEASASGGAVHVWGIAPSEDGQNERKFAQLALGTVVLFGARARLIATGVVSAKFVNAALAAELWKPTAEEPTWSQIYLLRDVQRRDIPKGRVNAAIGHKLNDAWQRVNLLDEEPSEAALELLEIEVGEDEEVSEDQFASAAASLAAGGPLDIHGRVKLRREQSFLRRRLFKGMKVTECGICGRPFAVELLVAAHIKKRADCTEAERLDYRNVVIPMCKLGCDALYEGHFISVVAGRIEAKRRLTDGDAASELVKGLVGRSCPHWNEERRLYFEWHTAQ